MLDRIIARRDAARSARLPAIAGVALCFGVGTASGLVQPEPDAPMTETTADAPERDESSALRDRLERLIARSEAMLERHREALQRLDAGESPAEVLRTLRLRDFDRRAGARAAVQDGDDPEAGRDRPGPDAPGRSVRPGRDGPEAPGRAAGAATHADLDPQLRQRLRRFLAEKLPSVSEQLAQVETVDAELGAKLFDRLAPQLRDVVAAIDRDPAFGALKLAELKAGLDVVDATQRVRSLNTGGTADAAALETAREQLRAAIEARFDARIRLREHELERLAEQITGLHRQIQLEREGRDDEIDRVYDAVISQRWGRGAGRPASRPKADPRADE